MICNHIIDNTHLFKKTNEYIVDTNVITGLFGHPFHTSDASKNKKLKKAMEYYNKAISAKAKVYVPAVVLSEYINLYFTERFKQLKKEQPHKFKKKKKDYWESQEYKDDCEYINNVIQHSILHDVSLIDDEFDSFNMEQAFAFNNAEFNDNLIIHIANKKNMYVISGDMDFSKIPIH